MGAPLSTPHVKKEAGYKKNPKHSRQLLKAVEAGDALGIEALLQNQEVDINIQDDNGNSPLHIAAEMLQMGTVRLLLECGADAALANRCGQTPLHTAALGGDPSVVQLLLSAGAKDSADSSRQTALHLAVQQKHYAAVGLLANAGSDVNAESEMGSTPLHAAIEQNNTLLAEILLQQGANCAVEDVNRDTPLHIAVKNKNMTAVKMIMKHANAMDIIEVLNSDVLLDTVFNGDLVMVELLLSNGLDANVSSPKFFGLTALHLAILKGNNEIVNVLLRYEADVLKKGAEDKALFQVVEFGQKNITDVMLRSVACLDIEHRDKHTPLHYAVFANNIAAVSAMLETRPFNVDPIIDSLLQCACMAGLFEMLKTLVLNHAGNTDSPDTNGNTLVMSALQVNRESAEIKEMVEFLLQHGANCNAKNKNGDNLIDLAIRFRQFDLIPVFIMTNMNLNSMNKLGETVLLRAVRYNHLSVVKMLLAAGAKHPDKLQLLRDLVNLDDPEMTKCLLNSGILDEVLKTKAWEAGFSGKNASSLSIIKEYFETKQGS